MKTRNTVLGNTKDPLLDLHCPEYARGMIRSLFAATLAVSLVIFPQTIAAAADDSTVHQIGTFDYLVQPDFTGLQQADKVTDHSTLGLGTFANLDGELVMVGGVAYRVPTTGIPERITGKELTPFIQAINFKPTKSGPIPPGTQCSQLIPAINALVGTDQGIIAVRVRGTFTQLEARSVPKQEQPWPTLATVIGQQSQFNLDGKKAVLVGFRQGSDFLGVGQPGLHLHGLTSTKNAGGHILSCTAGSDVQLSVQRASSVDIKN
jgi:acetolactate decarboxylase